MPSEKLFKGGVEVQDGHWLLRVSKDRLQAVLSPRDVTAPVPLDPALLARELAEQEIVAPPLPAPEPAGNGLLCVARGTPPVAGEDARVKLHVKPSLVHVPKQVDPDKDQVDYRELGSIVNVGKDRLLLEKVPPTAGTPGRDLFAVEIPAKTGKDRKLKYGKGVYCSDDEMRIYAGLDGKYVMADGRPSVFAEHVVRGDVDLSVGNIAFIGTRLEVSGEVLPGFNVKCRGDILIRQGLNNATVMAGGTLVVLGGVMGEEALLQARGDITVDFTGNGPRIESGGALHVHDFLMQTEVRAAGDLIATQGKGTIIGGKLIVAGSIHVRELGSEAEILTDVSVGVVPALQEKKLKIEEEVKLWSDRFNEVIKNISGLEKMKKEQGGVLPPDKGELLKKCQLFMPRAMDKVNALTEEGKALEAELEQMVNERIFVYDRVFPGVVVRIGGVSRAITMEEEQAVIFYDRTSRQILVRKMTREEREAMPA
jgi:uncharacterized protein